mgnify:CR=1 FL=1
MNLKSAALLDLRVPVAAVLLRLVCAAREEYRSMKVHDRRLDRIRAAGIVVHLSPRRM